MWQHVRAATIVHRRCTRYGSRMLHEIDGRSLDRVVGNVVGGAERRRELSTTKRRKFYDRVRIQVSGGRGGFGNVSKDMDGRPDGGNGGLGGNVVVRATSRMKHLALPKHHFKGGTGRNGSRNGQHGRAGDIETVDVPIGTVVKQLDSPDGCEYSSFDESVELGEDAVEIDVEEKDVVLVDLDVEGAEYVLCRGGKGGIGNKGHHGKRITRKERRRLRRQAASEAAAKELEKLTTKGEDEEDLDDEEEEDDDKNFIEDEEEEEEEEEEGEEEQGDTKEHHTRGAEGATLFLELELKTIADVGLVGFPNAGKSTLLRALSRARPKVANYPFTTLQPSVGMLQYGDGVQISVADIPGIIDGAHQNRGLGHDFLRHIERTRVILYVLDGSKILDDDHDLCSEYVTLREELRLFSPDLVTRKAIVAINKIDTVLGRLKREAGVETGLGETRGAIRELDRRIDATRESIQRLDREGRQGNGGGCDSAVTPVLAMSALEGTRMGDVAMAIRGMTQSGA